jgi:hypothetical protein
VTHEQAVQQNLAEKYLLSELDEADREEFELHFFSCSDCAADLRDGALFIESGRTSIHAPLLPEPVPSFWERWFPVAARPTLAFMTAALVLVSGASLYQLTTLRQQIAGYQEPRQVPGFTLFTARRGPQQTIQIPKGAREVQIQLDVTSEETYASYRVQIGSLSPIPVSAPSPGGLVQILVPVSRLPQGEATIRVQGLRPDGSQTEVGSYQIRIQESP